VGADSAGWGGHNYCQKVPYRKTALVIQERKEKKRGLRRLLGGAILWEKKGNGIQDALWWEERNAFPKEGGGEKPAVGITSIKRANLAYIFLRSSRNYHRNAPTSSVRLREHGQSFFVRCQEKEMSSGEKWTVLFSVLRQQQGRDDVHERLLRGEVEVAQAVE